MVVNIPETADQADEARVTPEVLSRARELAREFSECMWFRHPDAAIKNRDDVRLVIEHLREYGGHRAWGEAQKLYQCL